MCAGADLARVKPNGASIFEVFVSVLLGEAAVLVVHVEQVVVFAAIRRLRALWAALNNWRF